MRTFLIGLVLFPIMFISLGHHHVVFRDAAMKGQIIRIVLFAALFALCYMVAP